MSKIQRYVRIIAVPPGEAPLWVREKWVGLELPLGRWQSPQTFHSFGAVSGPRKLLPQLWAIVRGRSERLRSYPVEAARGIDILETASPGAAAWWQQNASEFIQPKRYLLFHAGVCELVAD